MKKHLFTLILSLFIMVPAGLNAQSADGVAKGKRGGYIMGAEGQVNFEVVTKGTAIHFYPCTIDGSALAEAPATVDITIIAIETTQKLTVNEVAMEDGSFTVNYNLDFPIYMYSVSYVKNGEQTTLKYRVPGAPQAR